MFIYRIILTIFSPLVFVVFVLRRLTGKDTAAQLSQRLSGGQSKSTNIWLHGASLGELTAAKAFLEKLISKQPAIRILITMNSVTAHKMVADWGIPQIQIRMAPLDYRFVLNRFLRKWQPGILITLENELWPNRIALCNHNNIPVYVLGGRMSAKAASMWARFDTLAKRISGAITYVAPLDATARTRFTSLGVTTDRIGPAVNFKSSVELPAPNTGDLRRLSETYPRETTLLAASTHEGEDHIILDAFQQVLKSKPDMRLILAPRHPNRAQAIAALIKKQGLQFEQRSSGGSTGAQVLLADTLGEMPLWYSLAQTTFIGGTLVAVGGHTPFEPIQFNSAIIHGPEVSNHNDVFQALDRDDGAIGITNATELARAFIHLSDQPIANQQIQNARISIGELQNNSAEIDALIDRILETLG